VSKKLSAFATIFASCTACMFVFAGVVSAHVTVWPKTSTVGTWEKYTLRVPTEKNIPTEKVVLKVPDGVTFEQYEAVPGWSVSEQKGSNGSAKTITWTALSQGIAPGQFQEFSFVAQNPKSPENVAWDAYQYYQDQSIVEWAGVEGSQSPHSVTDIMAATSSSAPNILPDANSEKTSTTITVNTMWSTILSAIAIGLSLVSIFFTIRQRRS
jgi:uncharacterized protein YcnI